MGFCNNGKWTQHGDERLRRLVAMGKRNREIAAITGRTLHAIENRIKVLGIKRDDHGIDIGAHQTLAIDSIRMVVTPWEDLPGGVRRRFVHRADDAGILETMR